MSEQSSRQRETTKQEGIDQVQHGRIALKILGAVMGLGFLLVLLLAIDTPSLAAFLRRFGVSALVAGACAFVGALVGFIFGIPRTLQGLMPAGAGQAQEGEGSDSSRKSTQPAAFQHNTNLEDISDWLTKILVGVGLTQLTTLPERLWSLAETIAPGLGSGEHAQILALATIVFYLAAGFLFSYLWTRLYFKGALAQADALDLARRVEESVSQLQAQSSKDALALSLVGQHLNPVADSPEVDVTELKTAVAQASSAAKTTIYQQAWETRSRWWRDDKPRMERTIPVLEALIEGDLRNEFHANHGQLGWALKDKEEPDWARAERELSTAIAIRGDWRESGWLFYEANRAVCRIMMSKDPAHAGRFTDEEILEDLRVAAHLRDRNFTVKVPEVIEWLEARGLTADDIQI